MLAFGDGLFKITDGGVPDAGVNVAITFAGKTSSAMVSAFKSKGRGLIDGCDHTAQWVFGACAVNQFGVKAGWFIFHAFGL